MKALLLSKIGPILKNAPPALDYRSVADPVIGDYDVLIKVSTCSVCHTDLDIIEGRTPPPRLPIIPGHQIVGIIEKTGAKARGHAIGDRVGVGWISSTCGTCKFCRSGQENLCPDFKATGRDLNGGYADYAAVPAASVFSVPSRLDDTLVAPLLCAGSVGYRALKLSQIQKNGVLGLTGFGGSGHLVLQVARHLYPDLKVYVFARSKEAQDFARELGADWAGKSDDKAPQHCDAIIDTTPAWKPIIDALKQLRPGGRLVINAIRKESQDRGLLAQLDYEDLWLEREIKTVANVTRADISDFLSLCESLPISPSVTRYPLADANQALIDLKFGHGTGTRVLEIYG